MKIYTFFQKTRHLFHKIFICPFIKMSFNKCGKNINIGMHCSFYGTENITVGNNVSFGEHDILMSTKAKIIIGDHVMFAPNVSIITGTHRVDLPGIYMTEIKDSEKLPENDLDVIFEGDNYIGLGAIILKGVIVHKGAVVGAGALVTKDVPEYSIVAGNPARILRKRFE